MCRDIPALPGAKGALYDVLDLRVNPPGGSLCRACSKDVQRPIRHPKIACPIALKRAVGVKKHILETNTLVPDPARFSGVQNTRSYNDLVNKPRGSHPCQFPDCIHHAFNEAAKSNSHLVDKHRTGENDETLMELLYEDPIMVKKKVLILAVFHFVKIIFTNLLALRISIW